MSDIKLEVDGVFRCPQCDRTPYRLYRRQTKPGSEIFEHVVWPTDKGILPPAISSDLRCPKCNVSLKRE